MTFRVGFGQDSHPFGDDPHKPLMLGGVPIAGTPGFVGNSDGDVVLHALCDAIEQAIGGNSFALYADTMCARDGITDSAAYVSVALAHMRAAGWEINNVGVSVEGSTPRVMPHVDAIRRRLCELIGCAPDAVGINATSGERLSDYGRGEGMMAHVIVSVVRAPR